MIVTFQGIDHKIGSTMVSQSVAAYIAKKESGKKILNLALNEQSGRAYSNGNDVYLDDFLEALTEHRIKLDDFYDGCWTSGNLVFFGGLKRRYQGPLYWPKMSQELLTIVQEDFSHIIIDAGNNLSFGLAAPDGAPSLSDKFIVVGGQNAIALKNMIDVKQYYMKYRLQPFAYVINKYDDEEINDIAYIRNQTEIKEEILSLPEMGRIKAMDAERTQQTFQDKVWLRAIQVLADFLLEERE